jgi:hypothetical protein
MEKLNQIFRKQLKCSWQDFLKKYQTAILIIWKTHGYLYDEINKAN